LRPLNTPYSLQTAGKLPNPSAMTSLQPGIQNRLPAAWSMGWHPMARHDRWPAWRAVRSIGRRRQSGSATPGPTIDVSLTRSVGSYQCFLGFAIGGWNRLKLRVRRWPRPAPTRSAAFRPFRPVRAGGTEEFSRRFWGAIGESCAPPDSCPLSRRPGPPRAYEDHPWEATRQGEREDLRVPGERGQPDVARDHGEAPGFERGGSRRSRRRGHRLRPRQEGVG
jgi:hypothetical protein